MKYNILTVSIFISLLAFSQEDYRTQARQYEERKATDKVNTERINTQYTNNLPNGSGTSNNSASSDAQVKANAEAWWSKLKSDLAAAKSGPLPGTTGGGFTAEQRYEFEATGVKRRSEQQYISSLLAHYHENLNGYLEKIKSTKTPCQTGDCKDGIVESKTETFNISAVYKNGMLNGVISFYTNGDPKIKNINLTYKDNVLNGQGTVFYHDKSFENLKFFHNTLSGEAALVFPHNEAIFFNRNQGKISGILTHSHSDNTKCSFLYRNDAMFTMLKADHSDFTYPSQKMYTGNFYLYIKEETMTKMFDDDGKGGFYAGEFKKNSDTPHGFGTHAWESGNSYTGDVSDNAVTGKGTFYYYDGGVYEGEVKKSNRHGEGTVYYTEGNKYTGTFKDNNRHGQGIYTRADGYTIKGKFKNDYTTQDVTYYNNDNVEISSEEYYKNEEE